ncbi:Uncharacterised protein [Dermatophilus congolensis]|uniref:DUF4229 domain-containing protein n=2 Tax=Dermatophilus congolensis TaxID=1863 RepID=A0AA46BL36_9MICO|nr:Uncharacterised protein [Dermatophilus congolensis]
MIDMRPSIVYSFARISIFLACLLILWLVGLKDPLVLLLVAATVSMLISLFTLGKLRDRFAVDVAERVERRRQEKAERRAQVDQSSAEEDSEADSFR